MTFFAIYSSPTTPGAAGWQEDVTGSIRLGSITGLAGEARLGATGNGNIVLDDPDSTIGHLSDGIVGLKQFHFTETACPVGNQRLWTGYVGDREYRRGEGADSSLRTGAAREIDITLVDLNDFLSFRVFAPEALDPTSFFEGEDETHIERVQRLLNDVDFISTTLFDIGYIPSTGGVDMKATPYVGKRPIDVLNDCAQVSGWNFFVLYDEASNQFVLWFDDPTTDGSDTIVYDSALRLTNVKSEVDDTTTFAAIDPRLTYDPSRLVSAAYGNGNGVTGYETLATTANTYAWRDMVADLDFITTQTEMDAALTRYLADNSTEAATIRCSVQLPRAYVTGIHEGMRLQVHFTHLPLVNGGFFWTRVLSRTIRVDVETQEYYWLDLELSPIPLVSTPQMFTHVQSAGCNTGAWPEGSPGAGLLLVGVLVQRGGTTNYGPGVVPIGNEGPVSSCVAPDIAGTDWTYLGSKAVNTNEYPQTMAMRFPSIAGEPEIIRWGGAGGLGSTGPRSYQIALEGMAGTEDGYTSSAGFGNTGTVFTSHAYTISAPGIIIASIMRRSPGPSDGSSAAYTFAARAPAQDLLQGYANSGFAPNSWFGMIEVTPAMFAVTDTYTITLDCSAIPRDPGEPWSWQMDGFPFT